MLTNSSSENRQILTVTKLNRLSRMLLESEIGLIWLSAEISNFVRAASGHWYFTLKDSKAQVRAAMFKNANRRIQTLPKEGDKVLVRASVGLYEPRGDYQLIVEHLEKEGQGTLKQAFEALKMKLYNEGLFSPELKRPLPDTVTKVGIITSPSGAALHDALTVFKRRSPTTTITIYPSMVQGDQAASQLIDAINTANRRNEVDVILLTRGGGSMEDLWCFNDEHLARTIRNSAIPIVSAVGHEIDVTIADYIADLRAPTPSAGAELLSQDQDVLLDKINALQKRLQQSWREQYQRRQHKLAMLHRALRAEHPSVRIQNQIQWLDRLSLRLQNQIEQKMASAYQSHSKLDSRLGQQNPKFALAQLNEKQRNLNNRLVKSTRVLLDNKQRQNAFAAQRLHGISPLATLGRGYSITFKDNKAAMSTSSLTEGDEIRTRLHDGDVTSVVTALTPTKSSG